MNHYLKAIKTKDTSGDRYPTPASKKEKGEQHKRHRDRERRLAAYALALFSLRELEGGAQSTALAILMGSLKLKLK